MLGPPAPIDLLEDLLVSERSERQGNPGDPACLHHAGGGVDEIEQDGEVRLDRLAQGRRPVRQREHRKGLAKVRVGGLPVQELRRFAACLPGGASPQPRAPSVAGPERPLLRIHCLDEATLRAALAADRQVDEVTGRSRLVEPQVSPAGGRTTVREGIPVHVVDVPGPARADEPDRHDWTPVESIPIQCGPVHQPARQGTSLLSSG